MRNEETKKTGHAEETDMGYPKNGEEEGYLPNFYDSMEAHKKGKENISRVALAIRLNDTIAEGEYEKFFKNFKEFIDENESEMKRVTGAMIIYAKTGDCLTFLESDSRSLIRSIEFFENHTEGSENPFNKIAVIMFTEQIATPCFPTLEFANVQIKGTGIEIVDIANDLVLDKAYAAYSNAVKIGYEYNAIKAENKDKGSLSEALKRNPKLMELFPTPDDIKRLVFTSKLMKIKEYLQFQSKNIDMIMESDIVWPNEQGLTY